MKKSHLLPVTAAMGTRTSTMPVPEMVSFFRSDEFVALVYFLTVDSTPAAAAEEYQYGKSRYYCASVFHTITMQNTLLFNIQVVSAIFF
jgi:hypothetical protein